MNMIKRFVRLTAAKYSELITGTKVDEDAFYFLEDTGELFKGSVQLTDALVVIDSIDNIPDVKTIRKGRFYVDKNGGVAGMVNDQWTKFIDPKARPINYVEDASQQPAGAKEGVFYFDGVNLGVVNGASYVNLSKFDASVCSLVKDATVRPQNLVNGHFYLDTKGNVGVAIQLTEDPNSLDYNLIIQPNTNYVTLSKVEDTIKEANKVVATAYTAADTVLKQAVDEVLNTLKGQVGALEANFEEGKAKEAKVADIAHELENLPTDKIATKEESEKAVADLKADIEAKMLNKVEVVVGKQLSTEDFTTEEKEKLAGLEKYTLPVASEEELGGVKVGEGLYVTDGKLNVHEQDLSAYAKTAAVEEKLNDYTKAVEVQTQLEAYAKKTELPSIEGLAKTTEVDAKLVDYAKEAEVNTKLAEKADATVIPTLATKAEVTAAVEGVAKTAEVDTKLADYAKTADIANTYATKEAINAVAGLDADTVAELKVLAQNSDLTTVAAKVANVYTKAESDAKLVDYAKKTDVETKLAAKADVTAIPDVSGLATKAEVTAAVAGVQVPSIEGLAKTTEVEAKLADYAKTTEVDAKLVDYAKKTELPSIEGLAKTTDIEAAYAKKTELPDVSGLATKQEVTDAVAGVQVPSIEGLAKTTEVEAKLADYAKTAEVDTKLADYAKTAEIAETYATKEAINAVAGLDADTVSTLKTLAQNSDLTTVAEKVKNVYTKAETDDKLAAKADVTAIPDVSGLATKAEVTAAVAGVQVPSIEGLAKTTEVEAKLATKADVTAIPDVSGLATKAEVETTYAKKTELPDISGLATKAEVAAITVPSIEGLAKTTDVDTKLADYAKKTELPSVEGLATKAEVTEAVTGLAKASEVAATYATKEAVNAVAGLDADTVNQLKALAQNSDLTTVAEKVKNVYTKSETDDKLAAKADITAIPDVSGLATKQEVTDAVAGVQVPSIEGLAKTTDVEATYAKKSELPDVSGLATKQEVTNAVAAVQVPSIEGLAKTTEVETKLADYAKKTELPSIEGLAKTTDVDAKLVDYAKKTELPDVSALATKAEVAAITVPSVEGFIKGAEVDAKLVDYAKKAEVETTYAKKTELPDISGLATKAEVTAAVAGVQVPSIEGLAKTTEVETKLADYAKTTDIEAAYAKKAELPSIEGLAKTTEVDTKLADYAKSADIANTYATKEAVNAVAGLDVETVNSLKALAQNSDLATVADKVKNVYTKAETDTKLATKADVTAIPDVSGLAVKSEVETTYAKKTELPDVSGLATKAEVTAAVAAVTVPSIEGLAKTTEVEAKLADYAKKTELPSIEGLAKTTEVDTKLAAKADVSAIPDVSGLATKAEVAAVDAKFATKADASAIPSIEGLAKTTDIEAAYAKKTELPDVSGLATKAEVEALKTDFVTEETLTQNINQFSTNVDGKINEAKGELEAKVTAVDGKLAEYAKKTELPSVEGLAKATEIESTYAKKTELPDVSRLVTKTELSDATVNLATKSEVGVIEGRLTEFLPKSGAANLFAQKAELNDYLRKDDVSDVSVTKAAYDAKVQELESEISTLKAKLAAVASGTTEQRPTENLVVGQQYFDTTLGVPVYWNGTEWHNPFAKITTVEIEH